MYSTCMFCNRPLGSNEVVETFPVGRRLAFDADKGRLWVVCPRCERWNLSPIEERWEAVESLERLFRGTRVRVSTENVGLARHPEGLEMVRIGEPLRPEFAAWRYGDQFGRRRRRALLYGVGGGLVVGGVLIGGVATGVVSSVVLSQTGNFVNMFVHGRTLARVRAPDGTVLKLRRPDLAQTRLEWADDRWDLLVTRGSRKVRFTGDEAWDAAAVVAAAVNRAGAKKEDVQQAVRTLDTLGTPEAVIRMAARSQPEPVRFKRGGGGGMTQIPLARRLALEMALHEEEERRALEGELWLLERRWKEAEEIAAISDGLLLPEGTEAFLDRARHPEKG